MAGRSGTQAFAVKLVGLVVTALQASRALVVDGGTHPTLQVQYDLPNTVEVTGGWSSKTQRGYMVWQVLTEDFEHTVQAIHRMVEHDVMEDLDDVMENLENPDLTFGHSQVQAWHVLDFRTASASTAQNLLSKCKDATAALFEA
mmetsp:Transcript_54663/g.166107  ORF Transcript_54663/g.166107 Transcript_54663/m.166107 type:complete len:144 (-) Transcript_54663:164-595(-)|eukprot:CAMPEP_0198547438 /NCGR_PEP_ID=MMETSP1462-20131121/67554_1 /TAXON_ID=1333877 /ORGANISM="Brandtodinium nutriculum, Strain RCC3387" /LENGTH=143 /DNA_ID=CAMNT_0044277927 /DNA_START=40 /DNA_END=471 /DNA_ORIENTATION=+